jgi:hypothetical protein
MRLTAALAFSTLLFAASCGPVSQQCGPDNCTGCCSAAGVCEPGSAVNSCGEGGGLCSACSGSDVCTNHSCAAPVCDATTCPTGCCVGNVCQPGNLDSACGATGTSCEACSIGTTCQANACKVYVAPITATAETWTWVGFPDSACGNGAATGIGVNLTTRSTDVLIYMQGGGACWDTFTCGPLQTATAIDTGYTASSFNGDNTKLAPPFSRSTATNPFKDMSYVYVPYCTGDVHAGDAVTTYPASSSPVVAEKTVHHKGAANMRAYLTRLAATFPNATRVFVSGSSAGAYGAEFNFAAVKAAFPNAEIHVLADCGQMINPAGTTLAQWVAAWNLQVPAGCTGCDTDFTKYPTWLFSTYPQSRFALLAYTQDGVLSQFFGYSGADFETQTRALLTTEYVPTSNAKYYLVSGNSHVMLGNLNTITNNNVTLLDWTSAFVTGTGWASVNPP